MSRRTLAPSLLLFAAVGSIAAIFAVHDIESAGGPLAEPFVSRAFSPGRPPDDGGVAVVRFTTQQPERVSVRIVDRAGRVRRTLLDRERIDGRRIERWDGTGDSIERVLPDGTYRVRITRDGDRRVYAPNNPVRIDTQPPVARFDTATLTDGVLRGLVLMDTTDGAIAVRGGDGERIDEQLRALVTARGTPSVTPRSRWPRGTQLVRFQLPFDDERLLATVQVSVVDAARNRTDLLDAATRRRIRIAP